MKHQYYLLVAVAFLLSVVAIACTQQPVSRHGEIRGAHIVTSTYPELGTFVYYTVGGNLNTTTIITDTVPIGNLDPNENMEFAWSPSSVPYGAQRAPPVGCHRIGGLQISSHTPSGESRT